ncbi:hypothetical protein ACFZB9_09955 [Kitasatospora sp. NPDC008050]|uniref:hypothetical protein n=1 Tax=Kitasatospora sp. NPDC008050 TaxID=3364021 RepID=UPI0036F04548
MERVSRESLERLTRFLDARLAEPTGEPEGGAPVEPVRRTVRHAVAGIEAYLAAVEAGTISAPSLHAYAEELWDRLQHIAQAWPDAPAGDRPQATRAAR